MLKEDGYIVLVDGIWKFAEKVNEFFEFILLHLSLNLPYCRRYKTNIWTYSNFSKERKETEIRESIS